MIKEVCIIGAPLSEGQKLHGVGYAPKAMRDAGLRNVCEHLGYKFLDVGDTNTEHNTENEESHEIGYYSENEIPNSLQIGQSCCDIYHTFLKTHDKRKLIITIGGDHSVASGSLAGSLSRYPDLCVLWVDAHADANTPEISPSGNYHGMTTAHLMKWFKKDAKGFHYLKDVPKLEENRIAYVGLRDVDPEEAKLLKDKNVKHFTMYHIDKYGISQVLDRAMEHIDPNGERDIHLSLDIDVCDPSIAPGTGTRARGGLSYREIHFICEYVAETRRLVSMDLVEINPSIDQTEAEEFHGDQLPIGTNATKTVRLGLELIASALGNTIV